MAASTEEQNKTNVDQLELQFDDLGADGVELDTSPSFEPRELDTTESAYIPHGAGVVPWHLLQWDFFLSHKQSNAQDAVAMLRMCLADAIPGSTFWIDTEQDPTEKGMRHGVRHCKNFLLYLTEGVTESMWCQKEIRWAIEFKKNIILVGETDPRHGKIEIGELIQKTPEDIQILFKHHVVIPWQRDAEFRKVAMEKIVRECAKEEANLIKRDNSKPLMFGRSGTSKTSDDEEGVEDEDQSVFHPLFVWFTAICGVALPGASKRVRYWSVAVRLILLTCGLMCCSRVFTTDGPAYLDTATIIQIVLAHPMIFYFLHNCLRMLESDLVFDLLQNHIDCSHGAKGLKFRTMVLTALAILATAGLTFWGWAGYLTVFFDPYYILDPIVQPDVRPWTSMLFGLAHGLTWILILPIFYGSLMAALLITMVLQELGYMNLVTALYKMHRSLAQKGLDKVAAAGEGLDVRDGDLYRFESHYTEAFRRYKALHTWGAIPFLIFWGLEICLLAWSIWSITQGFKADPDDPRVERLEGNWGLHVRLAWFVGGSPWFGIGAWLVACTPWAVEIHAWWLPRQARMLLFGRPDIKTHFHAFFNQFPLYFNIGFLNCRMRYFPLYAMILAVNTIGYDFDAARVWNNFF